MNWYSVKEYKPAICSTYLVYQESTGYVLIADVVLFNDGTFKFENTDSDDYLEYITHFATIPPGPIIDKSKNKRVK
jgi:hypothetical protein